MDPPKEKPQLKRPASLAEMREIQAKRAALSTASMPANPTSSFSSSTSALDKAAKDGVTSFRGLFSDASQSPSGYQPPPPASTDSRPRPVANLSQAAAGGAPRYRSFAMMSRTQPAHQPGPAPAAGSNAAKNKLRNPFDSRSSASSIPMPSHSRDPFQILDQLSNPPPENGQYIDGFPGSDGAESRGNDSQDGLANENRRPSVNDAAAAKRSMPFKTLERTNSCPPIFAALAGQRPAEAETKSAEAESKPALSRRGTAGGRLTSALSNPNQRRNSLASEEFKRTLRAIDEQASNPQPRSRVSNIVAETFPESELPSFFQLYKRVAITSSEPLFELLEKPSWTSEASGMSLFASSVASTTSTVESAEGIPSCLYSWEFREKPGPASAETLRRAFGLARTAGAAVAGMRPEERRELEWWNGVEERWKAAFLSLYNTYRASATPYFYYVGAEFAVLFIGRSYSSTGDLQAFVSRTTAGFRDKLKAEGIAFEVLEEAKKEESTESKGDSKKEKDGDNDSSTSEDEKEESDNEDHDDGEPFSTTQPKIARFGNATSRRPIQCTGARHVHSLCDFLLNWKDPQPDRRANYGTPVLLSPQIFLHGQLQKATVEDKGSAQRPADDGSGKMVSVHRMELSGSFLLPPDLQAWLKKFVTRELQLEAVLLEADPAAEGLCVLGLDSGTVKIEMEKKMLARVHAKGGMMNFKYRSRNEN